MSDDQDPIWDALEELYRDGEVEVVPGLGSDTEPAFTLTEEGVESATALLREKDTAVLELLRVVITAGDAEVTDERVAEVIAKLAPRLRDDAGVNLLRVLRRQDPPWFNIDGLSAEEVAKFDP